MSNVPSFLTKGKEGSSVNQDWLLEPSKTFPTTRSGSDPWCCHTKMPSSLCITIPWSSPEGDYIQTPSPVLDFPQESCRTMQNFWEKSLLMELTQLLSETTVQAVGISCWNPLASEMHQSPKSGSAQLASKESHSEYSLENLWLDITFVLPLPVSQRFCWPISQRLGIHLETWASTRGMSLNSGCLFYCVGSHCIIQQNKY